MLVMGFFVNQSFGTRYLLKLFRKSNTLSSFASGHQMRIKNTKKLRLSKLRQCPVRLNNRKSSFGVLLIRSVAYGLIAVFSHYVYSSLHTSDCLAALEMANLRCSLTDSYDCEQDALAKRVNGILKDEFLPVFPDDLAQPRLLVDQTVYCYNEE